MASLRRSRSRPDQLDESLESLEQRLDRELDVPATVVCALCDDPDCSGCEQDDASRSGIVAILPWERPFDPALKRLWDTARAATRDAESFFDTLPDGPVLPALRFAALSELIAASSMLAIVVPIAAIVAPEWLTHVALDPAARSLALRLLLLGLPAFAGLLVLAHAAHGLSIDRGATKQGAVSRKRRALRFGLYACGWDLVIGPLGGVLVAWKEGSQAALSILQLGSGLPTRATKAFLRGAYRLDGAAAKRALRTSYVGAIVATVFGAFAILAAMIALLFL